MSATIDDLQPIPWDSEDKGLAAMLVPQTKEVNVSFVEVPPTWPPWNEVVKYYDAHSNFMPGFDIYRNITVSARKFDLSLMFW